MIAMIRGRPSGQHWHRDLEGALQYFVDHLLADVLKELNVNVSAESKSDIMNWGRDLYERLGQTNESRDIIVEELKWSVCIGNFVKARSAQTTEMLTQSRVIILDCGVKVSPSMKLQLLI